MKKSVLNKQIELPPKNESFMSNDNLTWFYFVLNYLPSIDKPLVFLPCGNANKTRGLDGRKYISQGFSHQLMSKITRNNNYTKIILSEPLSIIPYELESHPLRKDYNLPPNYLSIQSEFIFIQNVSMYLMRLKLQQPTRTRIYYLGATHHYFILYFANQLTGNIFQIIHYIPPEGLKGYSKGAEVLDQYILQSEHGVIPELISPNLEEHLSKRGRYTNLRFWYEILLMQQEIESHESINPKTQYQVGFAQLYQTMLGKIVKSKTKLDQLIEGN